MTQDFVFVGDPGKGASSMLETLRQADLSPKRCALSENMVDEIAKMHPVALMLSHKIKGLGEVVTALREEPSLTSLPVLVRLPEPDPALLESAFRSGVDDYVVDGSGNQFAALIAKLQKEDSWKTVRAPAGKVMLAHPDRLERIRLGRVLRRNGFDTFFAASTTELEAALSKEVRAVVVSNKLPGKPIEEIMKEAISRTIAPPPWVIVTSDEDIEEAVRRLGGRPRTRIFQSGTDAEGLTFLLNELLAPPPTGARRSVRILYGTPVSFVYEGGADTFFGFSFNINLGGLYIRTLTPLPLQTQMEVSFKPPFGRGQVVADAQVVWRKEMGDITGAASPPGMGIQFTKMWQADKAAYEAGYQTLLELSFYWKQEINTPGNTENPPPAAQ